MEGTEFAEESWSDIRKRARTVAQQISLDLAVLHHSPHPYVRFVQLIERAIDHAAQHMSKNKNVLSGLNEDQLTHNLITMLIGMSFDARFEQNVGGNCDITIEGPNDLLWLGEAKIYRSTGNILGGLRQLIDRYLTGLPGQDRGAALIYFKTKNALGTMRTWRDRLKAGVRGARVTGPEDYELWFRTEVPHAGSGRVLNIKHVAFVLFHEPTDTEAAPQFAKDTFIPLGLNRKE